MFVSPNLLDHLQSASTFAGIETWQGTVAFIDLAGYHEITKAQSPAERVRTLNANFEVIVPAITDRGGIVDKFMGDAIMAVFRGENHVRRALDACLDVRFQLRNLAAQTGTTSPFSLGVSIGVATGEMISGEIGSKAFGRLDYTVLGTVPRFAAKLESAANRHQILVEENTFEASRAEFDFVPSHEVDLPEVGPVFELVRRSDLGGLTAASDTMAATIDLTFPTDSSAAADEGPIRTKMPI